MFSGENLADEESRFPRRFVLLLPSRAEVMEDSIVEVDEDFEALVPSASPELSVVSAVVVAVVCSRLGIMD
jgi:hypothetical protein